MTNLSCGQCYAPLDACTCATGEIAAQSVATLEPAVSPTTTTCTGFINGRGIIEHPTDCSLHAYRKPLPGEWLCGESGQGWDGDETCDSTAFFIYGEAEITATAPTTFWYETDGGVRLVNTDVDTYSLDWDGDDVRALTDDPDYVMCSNCETEFSSGDPRYDKAIELWRKTL